MNKKICVFCVALAFSFLLTGCNDVKDLTSDETKMIAEYAADLLLKYDVSFDDKLNDGESKLSKNPNDTQEDTTQEASSEVTEETSTTETGGNDVSGKLEESTDAGSSEDVSSITDIASVIGNQEVSITYKDYMITKQYPATDEEGKFIYLDASEGYDLLVVHFNVATTSNHSVDLSLIDEDVDYKLVCNGSKSARPMLTLLLEDLGTLETTVNPSESQDAVLVFQISDSMKDQIEQLQLYISYQNENSVMDLK